MKNFIVAGMPRSGTTFLYHNLQRHPQIYVPFRREVNYFNVNFDQGVAWYESLYADAGEDQICADISPPCFLHEGSEERILEYNPEAKVILVVRDPLEWSLSFYSQFQSFEYNLGPYSEFVNGHDLKISDKRIPIEFQNDFVPRRIQNFMDVFGDRLLLLSFNVLKREPLAMLNTFEDFLGIDRYFTAGNFDGRKINASGRKNVKFLSYILSREAVIKAVEKLFPRQFVLSLRQRFDSSGAAKSDAKLVQYAPEDLELSERLVSDQQKWVDKLFSQSRFVLGTGGAFEGSAKGGTSKENDVAAA